MAPSLVSKGTFLSGMMLLSSFIQQTFTKHLLQVKPLARLWREISPLRSSQSARRDKQEAGNYAELSYVLAILSLSAWGVWVLGA